MSTPPLASRLGLLTLLAAAGCDGYAHVSGTVWRSACAGGERTPAAHAHLQILEVEGDRVVEAEADAQGRFSLYLRTGALPRRLELDIRVTAPGCSSVLIPAVGYPGPWDEVPAEVTLRCDCPVPRS